MPLFKTIDTSESVLYIWHITETALELASLLEPKMELALEGTAEYLKPKLAHNTHFLGTRVLLYITAGLNSPVIKNEFGKPSLEGHFISITHSHDYAGIMVSKTQHVALDIEKVDERILKVAHKFQHEDEKFFEAGEEVMSTTLIWCAKETLYKRYEAREVLFKEELRIHPFHFKGSGIFRGDILKGTPLADNEIHYLAFDNYVLTWLNG
jgi:4'-phosphopantetheinyl transferase